MHAVVELLGTKSGRDSASHKMDHFRSYRNYAIHIIYSRKKETLAFENRVASVARSTRSLLYMCFG
jgi:hypothetical protein